MPKQYFKKINFDEFKRAFGLTAATQGDWMEQPNGVLVRPLISEQESAEKNVTYIGLKFFKPTDGHLYRTQTDTIYFRNNGFVEFASIDDLQNREPYSFLKGDAIQIPPQRIRRIVPVDELEIELIVQPRFRIEDEVHVYD